MASNALLVDTNVFMHAAGGDHPYRAPCRAIVRALGQGEGRIAGMAPCVDTETFQEIAYRYASIGRPSIGRRLQESLRALPVAVLPLDREVIDEFVLLQERYEQELERRRESVRDLLHVAAAVRSGIETILSADRDLDLLAGVRRLDPVAAELGLPTDR